MDFFKWIKLTVFFNNRDIMSFIGSFCGQGTAIQSKANKELIKKEKYPSQILVN